MLTARDCQWEGFLPTLIPVKHLHREVTENETTRWFGFFFPQVEVIPSQKLSVHILSFIL